MFSLLYRQKNWKDLCLTTTISETKSGSPRSVTPLSHIFETDNSTCCLKWVPKNDESTNCIPMSLSSTWGSLWGQRAEYSLFRGDLELRQAVADFSSDLREIRGDCNLSLDASRSEKQIWFILDSLHSSSLYIHVCLTEMAWFSCPVLPSDDCGFLGMWILRFPWRSTDFFKITTPPPTPKT